MEVESFNEQSDYDFAVQHSEDLITELTSCGWERKEELEYQDCQTSAVFESVVDGGRVQLSLRKELHLFKEAWNSIDPIFYWTFINKRSPKFIGRDAVKMYLDQLFWLADGVWKVKSTRKTTSFRDLYQAIHEGVPVFAPVAIGRLEPNHWVEVAN